MYIRLFNSVIPTNFKSGLELADHAERFQMENTVRKINLPKLFT